MSKSGVRRPSSRLDALRGSLRRLTSAESDACSTALARSVSSTSRRVSILTPEVASRPPRTSVSSLTAATSVSVAEEGSASTLVSNLGGTASSLVKTMTADKSVKRSNTMVKRERIVRASSSASSLGSALVRSALGASGDGRR